MPELFENLLPPSNIMEQRRHSKELNSYASVRLSEFQNCKEPAPPSADKLAEAPGEA